MRCMRPHSVCTADVVPAPLNGSVWLTQRVHPHTVCARPGSGRGSSSRNQSAANPLLQVKVQNPGAGTHNCSPPPRACICGPRLSLLIIAKFQQ